MYQLYYSSGACSLAVQVKLQKAAVAYQPIKVELSKGQHLTEQFRQLNPASRVPVLVFEDTALTEAMALLLWLEHRHPQDLLPEEPRLQAQVLAKMAWLSNTLHIDFAALWRPQRFIADPLQQQLLSQEAQVRLLQHFVQLDRELALHRYWLSHQLTLADYYLLPFLRWGLSAVPGVTELTHLQTYLDKLGALPEVQAALALEQLPLRKV
jgi:glutathione S-transferase